MKPRDINLGDLDVTGGLSEEQAGAAMLDLTALAIERGGSAAEAFVLMVATLRSFASESTDPAGLLYAAISELLGDLSTRAGALHSRRDGGGS